MIRYHRAGLRAPSVSLSRIRHPLSASKQHILDRIEKLRPVEGESQEATLCIGGPGNFSFTSRPGMQIDWPDDHDEEEDAVERPRYKELQAVVRELRVTNPEDDEIYVDILARNASLVRDDEGKEFWIDWLQDLTNQTKAS